MIAAVALAVGQLLGAGCAGRVDPVRATTLVVDVGAPGGGDGTVSNPFDRLDTALDEAGPGATIVVRAGEYRGPFRTVRGGTEAQPMRIIGDRGATIVAARNAHAFTVSHDHVAIEGLRFRGADQLLVIEGAAHVEVRDNDFADAGGECVRLKRVRDVTIEANRVADCGRLGFDLAAAHKNGEGIYIGTAPEQADGSPDRSEGVIVRDNDISAPAECVDVKEGATAVRIESNRCRGGLDDRGGGISIRGDEVLVRANHIADQAGAGVRLGGDEQDQGVRNTVTDNDISGVRGVAVKVERLPQGQICGNRVDGAARGDSNTEHVHPTAAC